MKPILELIFDFCLNIITFGYWERELGEEILWIKGDGFGRPGED